MARPKRFELLTFWFVARRSIQLSYGRMGTRILGSQGGAGKAKSGAGRTAALAIEPCGAQYGDRDGNGPRHKTLSPAAADARGRRAADRGAGPGRAPDYGFARSGQVHGDRRAQIRKLDLSAGRVPLPLRPQGTHGLWLDGQRL